jgi:hypothetical protein
MEKFSALPPTTLSGTNMSMKRVPCVPLDEDDVNSKFGSDGLAIETTP